MSLVFIGMDAVPSYLALSTDIESSTIAGVSQIGKLVYTTDDAKWYVIESDLTLSEYALPVSFSGTISVGSVSTGTSATISDGKDNIGSSLTAPGDASVAPIISLPLGFNGSTWDKTRIPYVFKDISTVAITTIASIWTPATGKKFRLMGGSISVNGACSVLFEDDSAGNTIIRTPKLIADTPYNFDLGNGILSSAINKVLKATASTGTVSLTGFVYGTEE